MLAVHFFHQLEAEELWLAFGTGKDFHYIAAHTIAESLTTQEVQCLPMFHAATGCDTVSFFCGRGKLTAWQALKSYPDIAETFAEMKMGGKPGEC